MDGYDWCVGMEPNLLLGPISYYIRRRAWLLFIRALPDLKLEQMELRFYTDTLLIDNSRVKQILKKKEGKQNYYNKMKEKEIKDKNSA